LTNLGCVSGSSGASGADCSVQLPVWPGIGHGYPWADALVVMVSWTAASAAPATIRRNEGHLDMLVLPSNSAGGGTGPYPNLPVDELMVWIVEEGENGDNPM